MDQQPVDISSNIASLDEVLPNKIYILPVYGRPIFPNIVMPLVIHNSDLARSIIDWLQKDSYIGCVMVRDSEIEHPAAADLYKIGTVVKVIKTINLPDGGINLLINTLRRFEIKKVIQESQYQIEAVVSYKKESFDPEDLEVKALTRTILSHLRTVASGNQMLTEQIKMTMANISDPSQIADFSAAILNLNPEQLQEILETIPLKERMHKSILHLDNELKLLEIQKTIQKQINEKVDKHQREFFLREQLKAIKKELGIEESPQKKDYDQFKEKLDAIHFDPDIKEKIYNELEKFQMMEPHASEYSVLRNYIELIASLPWNVYTKDNLSLSQAEKILDADHYGLVDVKERILEFLAIRKIRQDVKGSILCLVGPPGVGKTSLGQSIARSMNRKFYRFSLGGMRDEAEIKGHRRTYVGALPGKILAALKFTKTANPVLMLDEIDKLGSSYQGDPASALLEVLDPEQNHRFVDHYLDIPFDLSKVLFITTGNTLDTIPRPLLDRMEVIRLSGYIDEEKYHIAKKYIIPKQVAQHGLVEGDVQLSKATLLFIVHHYAREAGVRSLERQIERICRKLGILKARKKPTPESITNELVRDYLGSEIYPGEEIQKNTHPGMVHGLAWTPLGGSTLSIESIALPGRENFKLTGQLGEVMTESANIAYSHIRSLIHEWGISQDFFDKNTLHLHVPAGATPKDGPSAGVTMATALLSLALNQKVSDQVGMTGELTLTGQVLPVGGIKEKMIAAQRAKLLTIYLPHDNQKDLNEIPDNIRKNITFHPVSHVNEIFQALFKKQNSVVTKGKNPEGEAI